MSIRTTLMVGIGLLGLIASLLALYLLWQAGTNYRNAERIKAVNPAIAAREISNSAQQAATGTLGVTQNIAVVNQEAASLGQRAADVLQMSRDFAGQSVRLRNDVRSFLRGIRSA